MKIEMIKSSGLTNSIKDISDRFGPSALILRNIEADGQEIFFYSARANCRKISYKIRAWRS